MPSDYPLALRYPLAYDSDSQHSQFWNWGGQKLLFHYLLESPLIFRGEPPWIFSIFPAVLFPKMSRVEMLIYNTTSLQWNSTRKYSSILIDRIDKSDDDFIRNALNLRERSCGDKEEGSWLHHYYRHLVIFVVNTFIKCINENPTKEKQTKQIKRKQNGIEQ